MRTVCPLLTACCLLVIAPVAVWAQTRPAEKVTPAPQCNPQAVVWRLPFPPKAPQAGDVWVNPKDGMQLVWVPAGPFTVGMSDQAVANSAQETGDPPTAYGNRQPQFTATLRGCWMGRTEVTNAQYQRFVEATRRVVPGAWSRSGGKAPAGQEEHPVDAIDWESARAYAEWAGLRLPQELEWEKAARGGDGRPYPWGFTWDPARCRNAYQVLGRTDLQPRACYEALNVWIRANPDRPRLGPAGAYPKGASPYGCLDMAGSVAEWCADWYDRAAYARYATGDLTPPERGSTRVLRGCSWRHGFPSAFQCSLRSGDLDVDMQPEGVGFRCARDPGK